MSTIPLPALHLNPPAPPADPLEQYGRLLQLRSILQNGPMQHQLLQQQLQNEQTQGQTQQLGLQTAQQDMQDRQAFRSAMSDPSLQGKTIGEVADVLAQSGHISQTGWVAAKKADVEQRQALASLDKDQLANYKAAHEATQQLYNDVMNMPDDQVAANWPQIANLYDSIPGNTKTPLNPNQPLTRDQLSQFGPMLSMHGAYLDEAIARRKSGADATKAENDANFGPIGAAADAKYQAILQKRAKGLPLSQDELTYAQAHEAANAKSTSTSDSLGVVSSNFSKPAGLASVGVRGSGSGAPAAPQQSPGAAPTGAPAGTGQSSPVNAKQSIVDLIGNYQYDAAQLSRLTLKHPDVMALVHQKYPDWDQTTYNAKNKLIQGYTSGQQSKEINAINTAMGHVKVLDDAVAALNNSDITALNRLGNSIGINLTGQTAPSAFKLIVHRVGPEITSAYIPGAGGEAERIANEQDFSENLPAQTLHNNAAITVKLLRSKVGALENQYKNTVGRDNFTQRFITPEAQSAFESFSGSNRGRGASAMPPQSVVDAAREGQFIHGPNGEIFKKINGKAVQQ